MYIYHKIQTVFKRDPKNKFRTLLEGDYSIPEFEYLKDLQWVFTEKIDGMNIRVIWDGEKVRFGGKTDRARISTFLYDKLQEMFITDILSEVFPKREEDINVCLYGEGYGVGIQKGGGNYMPEGKGVSFMLFDVKIGHIWLKREDIEDIAKKLNIPVVPIIGEGTLQDAVEMARKGFNSQFGDFIAEGIVLRPKIELRNRMGNRIIAKIKCKDL